MEKVIVHPTLGNFNLSKELGRGSYATVYLAKHEIYDIKVAIKVFNTSTGYNDNIPNKSEDNKGTSHHKDPNHERNMIEREYQLMRNVEHPLIVSLFDCFEFEGSICYLTEYVDGLNLLEYVNNKGTLSEREAKKMFAQMVLILDYIHNQKHIVHRDLKCENLIVDRYRNIHLIDFGFARYYNDDDENVINDSDVNETTEQQNVTIINNISSSKNYANEQLCAVSGGSVVNGAKPGFAATLNQAELAKAIDARKRRANYLLSTVCGSPAYVAPEIIQNRPYNENVDIWSLGILLYAIVHGYLPFDDVNSTKMLSKILFQEPKYSSKISPELIDLLQWMLKKNPKERATIQEIKDHPWLTVDENGRQYYLTSKIFDEYQLYPQSKEMMDPFVVNMLKISNNDANFIMRDFEAYLNKRIRDPSSVSSRMNSLQAGDNISTSSVVFLMKNKVNLCDFIENTDSNNKDLPIYCDVNKKQMQSSHQISDTRLQYNSLLYLIARKARISNEMATSGQMIFATQTVKLPKRVSTFGPDKKTFQSILPFLTSQNITNINVMNNTYNNNVNPTDTNTNLDSLADKNGICPLSMTAISQNVNNNPTTKITNNKLKKNDHMLAGVNLATTSHKVFANVPARTARPKSILFRRCSIIPQC